ncbi:hypothetical protein Lalb_Chr21g0312181 [Lupinus albus]|uniref:Uncharacterized protein n=1 Tax=Lupinus albus TaxID=3870 RepID=A0A6A4NQ42_LUPAL|nr:hypothetical protein Lalb_Chr21g0312181 [Lupinus albus]
MHRNIALNFHGPYKSPNFCVLVYITQHVCIIRLLSLLIGIEKKKEVESSFHITLGVGDIEEKVKLNGPIIEVDIHIVI